MFAWSLALLAPASRPSTCRESSVFSSKRWYSDSRALVSAAEKGENFLGREGGFSDSGSGTGRPPESFGLRFGIYLVPRTSVDLCVYRRVWYYLRPLRETIVFWGEGSPADKIECSGRRGG